MKEGRKYDLGAILVTQQPGSMAPEIMSQSDNWFSFHLLSEGDASTLGRYNSHFSHDILAHIIGEPIPGNCYMWSAPKQPFVLPVRIRNFEELYESNVVTGKDVSSYDESPAVEIRKKSEERNEQLAEVLLSEMKNTTLSTIAFSDENLTGIYYGQLYHLMKNVKEQEQFDDEVRREDQLFIPVLMKLFDCNIVVRKGEHAQKGKTDYYCAPTDKWTEKLGTE